MRISSAGAKRVDCRRRFRVAAFAPHARRSATHSPTAACDRERWQVHHSHYRRSRDKRACFQAFGAPHASANFAMNGRERMVCVHCGVTALAVASVAHLVRDT